MLSMIGMGFGGILNCVLDPIFIFNLDLGVAGASIATAISKVVSFSILIFPYITRRSLLHISLKRIHICKDILGQIVSVGSSSMFRNGLAVISAILLNNIAGEISDSVLAGVGVTTKVMMFPFGILLGFGTGFQPVAGFNWGAKRYDRVRSGFRFASRTAVAGGVLMAILLGIFSNQLILLFTEADAEMQAFGSLCICLQGIALPLHGWVMIVNMLCAGLGDGKSAIVLATSRQGTCFLPFLHLSAYLFGKIGVAGIQAFADALSLVLAVPIMRRVLHRIDDAERAFLAGAQEVQ